MGSRKFIFTFLITLCALLINSQTFVLNGSNYIGMTKKAIDKINRENNTKLFHIEKVGPLISIIYDDSLNAMTHHFVFARNFPFGPKKCISYFVTIDHAKFEKTKENLLTKCDRKISDMHAVQVCGTKKYIWHIVGSDTSSLCAFSVEKYREGSKYR